MATLSWRQSAQANLPLLSRGADLAELPATPEDDGREERQTLRLLQADVGMQVSAPLCPAPQCPALLL